ncbi:response regulator receiver protein [Deinococcus grandis]|uniref:Response regulator receiver protein n=1 Tax=Deinococcus grandis TaxID=57498 RepID=A0A117DP24_9DEIO|nr:response regulator [Deinococcus grandis]BBN93781.1 response regulator [Deinococcus grandis]GAQ22711.1 response regulator receiver protein [Deinococcus grandis]
MSRPFTVLLVEDELADAELFQDLLSEVAADIHVEHVENGQAALELLQRPGAQRPDLIVLDLNMPVMNGLDFLSQAKAVADLRAIPVMVLSTSDHPDDIHRAYDGYASGYVVKPGSYQEYTQVLDTVQAYWRGLVRLPRLEDLAR